MIKSADNEHVRFGALSSFLYIYIRVSVGAPFLLLSFPDDYTRIVYAFLSNATLLQHSSTAAVLQKMTVIDATDAYCLF